MPTFWCFFALTLMVLVVSDLHLGGAELVRADLSIIRGQCIMAWLDLASYIICAFFCVQCACHVSPAGSYSIQSSGLIESA